MILTWDPIKNRTNKRDHGLSFETAERVFVDSCALTRPDPHPDGDRLRTAGVIGHMTVFAVHTAPEYDDASGTPVGRLFSARKATPRERRRNEEDNT